MCKVNIIIVDKKKKIVSQAFAKVQLSYSYSLWYYKDN